MINVINVDADLTTYVAVSKVAKGQRKGQSRQGQCQVKTSCKYGVIDRRISPSTRLISISFRVRASQQDFPAAELTSDRIQFMYKAVFTLHSQPSIVWSFIYMNMNV